jgi:hypothetical protein
MRDQAERLVFASKLVRRLLFDRQGDQREEQIMRHLLRACGIATATATALAALMPAAIAEEITTSTWTCQIVGSGAREPLGDREGHAIAVSDYSCYIESGPFAGGDVTATNVWEWDKTNAVLVTGQSISRKAGSVAVYEGSEGKLALTMADGKVTGSTGSGRGTYRLVTGSAASLTGKSVTWTSKSEPGRIKVEVKVE